MSLGTRACGFVELTRSGNAAAAGVLTFTGTFVAGAAPGDALVVVAAMLATVFTTDAGNAIDDYFDRDIDRINHPDRPIPHDAVAAPEAKWLSVALFGGAVVSALILPVIAIAIAVVNLVAFLMYMEFFRGLPDVGSVVVAALAGSAFLFGGTAIGEPLGAAVLCVLVALATPTREIIKDVEDIDGDREEGLRTLPVVIDKAASLWPGVVVLVVAVDANTVSLVRGEFGLVYLGMVVPADALTLAATAQSFGNPAAAQHRLKHGMFLTAFAFILGRATAPAGSLL